MVAFANRQQSRISSSEPLTPLVSAWWGKVSQAIQHKEPFTQVAKQCMTFFSGGASAMWQADFFKQYVGATMTPKFKIGLQKAFELVALFGPTLYWRNPSRVNKPRRVMELDPMVYMNPMMLQLMGSQMGQQQQQMMQQLQQQQQMQFQQAMQQQKYQASIDKTICGLYDQILNWTPSEQPGGGLATHSQYAITEALVKGAGCLWPKPYVMPGSNRVMTGCFYKSIDSLYVDPDAVGPGIHSAKWIAEECVAPTWQVEREFNLPAGSLQGRGTLESSNRMGEAPIDPWTGTDRQVGKTFDLMTYYKIYSRGGVGGRLQSASLLEPTMAKDLDRIVGDYGYIVISQNVPYPLNMPSERLHTATEEEIRKAFTWPIPYWLDDRWPVSILSFYQKPNDVWPVAPLAPGLGELTFMNIMFSQLANQIWMNSRQLFVTAPQLAAEVEQFIKSSSEYGFVKGDSVMRDVRGMLQKLDFGNVPADVWKILEAVMEQFDRRTGISELMSGMNPGGVQSRTAEDIQTKKQMVQIRPDYMAGKVEDWQSDASDMERLCNRWFCNTQDFQGVLGPAEMYLYDTFVQKGDPEYVIRNLRTSIMANSSRKPDKQRDAQNLAALMQTYLPLAWQYYGVTRDPGPINFISHLWGEVNEQDVSGLMFQQPPPPNPQADPNMMKIQMLQQQMQLDAQNHQQSMQFRHQEHMAKLQERVQEFRTDSRLKGLEALTDLNVKLAAAHAQHRQKSRAA